jgi:hypothetical protein
MGYTFFSIAVELYQSHAPRAPTLRSLMGSTPKKWYRKEPYVDIQPVPFVALDYVLCAVVFLLIGIASNVQIANFVTSIGR